MQRFLVFLSILFVVLSDRAFGDEVMWLFNNPPLKQLKEKYNFEPTPQWLEHLQKSSVRFNSGGSGSFVSSTGLCITNHHVGLDTLQKISSEKNNYVRDGFYAKSQKDEVKATDLELNVLMSIEDVTDHVKAAVKPEMSADDANKARGNAIAGIEKESREKTGLRSNVITLYQGGQYHLYRYKRYDDVRLVFAPEVQAAFFGGDPDNFEYPRYDLDICFFRAYENGKAVHQADYLKWSSTGANDGELVFVSGHPGRTSRLNTVTHLEWFRDMTYPFTLNLLRRREVLLKTFSERSLENERRAHDDLFGIENSRKAYLGRIAGLQDPAILQKKIDAEARMRQKIEADPQLKAQYGGAWDQVAAAFNAYRPIYLEFRFLEAEVAFNSHLFDYARTLLRLADE